MNRRGLFRNLFAGAALGLVNALPIRAVLDPMRVRLGATIAAILKKHYVPHVMRYLNGMTLATRMWAGACAEGTAERHASELSQLTLDDIHNGVWLETTKRMKAEVDDGITNIRLNLP